MGFSVFSRVRAYASVSLAIDLEDGLMFVVKSTSAETMYSYRKSPELAAMESEISILRSLNCAHVISYLGDNTTYDRSGHASRNLFLEYMEGGSVSDLLKRCGGRLQEEQVQREVHSVHKKHLRTILILFIYFWLLLLSLFSTGTEVHERLGGGFDVPPRSGDRPL